MLPKSVAETSDGLGHCVKNDVWTMQIGSLSGKKNLLLDKRNRIESLGEIELTQVTRPLRR